MKVFHIRWNQSGRWELNAVVVAESAERALAMLELDSDDQLVFVKDMGEATGSFREEFVAAREFL